MFFVNMQNDNFNVKNKQTKLNYLYLNVTIFYFVTVRYK